MTTDTPAATRDTHSLDLEPKEGESAQPRSWTPSQVALATGAALFSVFIFLWTQVSMLVRAGWGLGSFRVYFDGDQISNFVAVVNGAHGDFRSVEPFTETGTFNDPHAYLEALGLISYITGYRPEEVWNIVGVALQIVMVVAISIAASMISRRWWAGLFGAVPLLIGTLSFSAGGWYTVMTSHGVLWGAFGSMFALNEASAALAITGVLFVGLLVVTIRSKDARHLTVAGVIVGAGIGLLANIDTYTFFTALFFACYGLSAYAVVVQARWWPVALSIALIVVLFLVGPTFADHAGRLVTFGLGLGPALPGIFIAISRWRIRVIAAFVAAVGVAAPQVIGVVTALHANNSFLNFRQASSTAAVGVDWKNGILRGLPLLVPLVIILVAGVERRRLMWVAYPAGSIVAWFLLATNDAWGTDQEPYQLWIDSFAVVAFTIVPVFLDVVCTYLGRRRSAVERSPHWSWRPVIGVAVAATVALAGYSSIDWFRFYKSNEGETFSLSTPQVSAYRAVGKFQTGSALATTDPCTNATLYKVATGDPVEFYNIGLAWPTRRLAINTVMYREAAGIPPTAAQLRAANIGWLVTDASCAENWVPRLAPIIHKVSSSYYGPSPDNVVTLWRVMTGRSSS